MFDVFAAPMGLEAGRKLANSAMPDAPVVGARPRRARRPLRLRATMALHRLTD